VKVKKIYLWLLTFSWAGLTLYLTTIPNFSPAPDTLFSWILSNGGHFFFFGILALLLKLDKLSTAYSVLLSSAYGLFIEYIQLNIPGRSFDLKDWALDTLGALTFLFLLKQLQSRV
jgi:VanZ family protein